MIQHASRQIDFRVKRTALGTSPWKRSILSRGALGYAQWQCGEWGSDGGHFAEGILRESGTAWRQAEAIPFPSLQLGACRGTERPGSFEPSETMVSSSLRHLTTLYGGGSLRATLPATPSNSLCLPPPKPRPVFPPQRLIVQVGTP